MAARGTNKKRERERQDRKCVLVLAAASKITILKPATQNSSRVRAEQCAEFSLTVFLFFSFFCVCVLRFRIHFCAQSVRHRFPTADCTPFGLSAFYRSAASIDFVKLCHLRLRARPYSNPFSFRERTDKRPLDYRLLSLPNLEVV